MVKTLEIKSCVLFNLDLARNAILPYLFFFFLIIGLCFLIPEVSVQILTSIAELVIPIGIPSKEAKVEIDMDPVTTETKIRKGSI